MKQIHAIPQPKLCQYCGQLKQAYAFSRLRTAPDGLQYRCKLCMRQYQRENQERVRKSQHEAYLKRGREYANTKNQQVQAEYLKQLESGDFKISDDVLGRLKSRLETEIKNCRCCKQNKPLTEFYIRIRRGKHINIRPNCKACHNRLTVEGAKRQPARTALSRYKKSAAKRGLDFELDLDFVKSCLESECSYCGEDSILMTVDRRDSNFGYVRTNCVPSCIRCNLVKSDMPAMAWDCVAQAMRKARELNLFGEWRGRRNFVCRDITK